MQVRTLLIAAAAAGAIGLLVLRGRADARGLTSADLPKLRQLELRKASLGRDLALCLDSQARSDYKRSISSLGIGAWIGTFVGAASGSAKAGITTTRKVAGLVSNLWPKGEGCSEAAAKLQRDLAAHDALSDSLGLDRDLSVEEVHRIAQSLGGYAAVNAKLAADIDAVSDRIYGDGYRESVEAALARLRYGMD